MNEDKTVGQERMVACLECDGNTYHKVLKSISQSESEDWGFYWSAHEIIMCLGCRTVSFRKSWGDDTIIGEENGKLIYDESEELFPSRVRGRKPIRHLVMLPSRVQQIFMETL